MKKPLPPTFQDFVKKYPAVWQAHEKLTQACADMGPLDRKTRELIKLGISVAAHLQTAAERHAVMAIENGATEEEIFQTVMMTMTTCGHPITAAGYKWVSSALGKAPKRRRGVLVKKSR
ncbi:MAG: carboxymuconolactone decarboxylase family protein [bacterium]